MKRQTEVCRNCSEYFEAEDKDKYACGLHFIELMIPLSRIKFEKMLVPRQCELFTEYNMISWNRRKRNGYR